AHPQTHHTLAHPHGRPGQRRPDGRPAGRGCSCMVRGQGRAPRHAPDGCEPAPGLLHRARVLPLARRAGPGRPLHRIRAPRHEPSGVLPAGGALGVLAPPPAERARGPRVARDGVARGARGDVRRRHGGDRDPKPRDPGLLLDARRPEGAGLLCRREPVERAAAPQRVSAPGRRPAPGVAGAEGAPPV
ncbi:MAG: hypothetical protein AVDCRST_MAG05-4392, partial [uncultured Rubrobacteraceae bacterium]